MASAKIKPRGSFSRSSGELFVGGKKSKAEECRRREAGIAGTGKS
jgi:hypothetical protein